MYIINIFSYTSYIFILHISPIHTPISRNIKLILQIFYSTFLFNHFFSTALISIPLLHHIYFQNQYNSQIYSILNILHSLNSQLFLFYIIFYIFIINLVIMEEIQKQRLSQLQTNRSKITNQTDQKIYLYLFQRFLESKLNPQPYSNPIKKNDGSSSPNNISAHKQKLRDTNRLISQKLMKRKLGQNNSQSRMNKMLEDFKSLETYINIKNFIQQMNNLNTIQIKKNEQLSGYNNNKYQIDEIREQTFYEMARQTQLKQLMYNNKEYNHHYKDLFEKVNNYVRPLIKINTDQIQKELQVFYNQIDNISQSRHNVADENDYDNPLQLMMTKQMKKQNDQNQFEHQNQNKQIMRKRRQSRRRFEKMIKQKPLPLKQIDQKYYSQFKRKASDIQKKMHLVLENMLTKKWKKKQKQLNQRKKSNNIKNYFYQDKQNSNKKPVINAKFKIYAPKNLFRFKLGKQIITDQSNDKNLNLIQSRRMGKKLVKFSDIQKIKPIDDRSKQKLSEIQIKKKIQHLQTVPEKRENNESRLKSCIKNLRKSTEENQCIFQCGKTSGVFEEIKTIKQKYSFKKPIIKQNILKKIDDFINRTEDRQYEFRKQNEHYNNMINRFEIHKELDYDKFNEQKVQINTQQIKLFHNMFRGKR